MYSTARSDSPWGGTRAWILVSFLIRKLLNKKVLCRHEQSRPDRDQYVQVQWDNIDRDSKGQFLKEQPADVDNGGVSRARFIYSGAQLCYPMMGTDVHGYVRI
jgi:hypothetical protein